MTNDTDLRRLTGFWSLGLAVLSFLIVATASGTLAHHGFGGRYDLSEPVWIEGEVTDAYFGQPHAELVVAVSADHALPVDLPALGAAAGFLDAEALVVREDTRGRSVELELPPTQQYFGLGDRIAVGDVVAAVAVRNCDAPHQLNVQWLRLADGEIVARSAAMSYMVAAC